MFWRLDSRLYMYLNQVRLWLFEIATSSQGWRLLREIALTSRAPVLYRGRSQTTLTSFWLFV